MGTGAGGVRGAQGGQAAGCGGCPFPPLSRLSPACLPAHEGVRSPTEPTCRVVFENEQDGGSVTKTQRKRSLVAAEPQHVTLIVFGIGMVNRTHLEADIGGLTMEAELKRIHGSFTLKEKMKGTAASPHPGKRASRVSGSRGLLYVVLFARSFCF